MNERSSRFEYFTSKHLEFSFYRILITSIVVSQVVILTIFSLGWKISAVQYAGLILAINLLMECFWINRSINRFRLEDSIDELMEGDMKLKAIPEELRVKMAPGLPFSPKYMVILSNLDIAYTEEVARIREVIKGFDSNKVIWSPYKSTLFFSEEADEEVVNFRLTFGV